MDRGSKRRSHGIAARGRLARKWAQVVFGLFLFALAMVLLIRSGLGLGPWDAFHVGMSQWMGFSVGTVVVVTGAAIVLASLALRVRPGPATIVNMVLIGVFVDLLLPHVPEAGHWTALPYHLVGIGLVGLATGLYIAPGLGKGPRDGLVIGLAERTGWPVGWVRTGVELSVLVAGFVLGGKIGVGTVLFALGIGPASEWGLRLFGVTEARAAGPPTVPSGRERVVPIRGRVRAAISGASRARHAPALDSLDSGDGPGPVPAGIAPAPPRIHHIHSWWRRAGAARRLSNARSNVEIPCRSARGGA